MGYMASGKSTIGKVLAKKLAYDFVDLDHYIEKEEKATIKEIFETKGEIYFRKKETYYLKEITNVQNDIVLSLGGGTPCYGINMEVLRSSNSVITIYLKASIGEIAKRLTNAKNKRPLVAHISNKEELVEFIGKHLFERSQYYNQAKMIINTDNKSKEAVVEEVVLELF